jgi:hypothetical protein
MLQYLTNAPRNSLLPQNTLQSASVGCVERTDNSGNQRQVFFIHCPLNKILNRVMDGAWDAAPYACLNKF